MNNALSVPKKSYRWGIVWLLTLLFVILYLDRTCISMVAPLMMAHFGWDAAAYGTVATAFFVGYICTNFLGGVVADKIGSGKLLIFASIAWSVFVFLTPLAPTFAVLLFFRWAMGAGEGVALPAIVKTVSNWVPKSESGRGIGLTYVGCPLGLALAMPLAAWIADLLSWQAVFYIFAFFAPVWIIVWLLWGADDPSQHRRVQQWEKDYILADKDTAHVSTEDAPDVTLKDIFKTISVWIMLFGHFGLNYAYYLFVTWLPNYFVLGKGMTMAKGAIYTMIPFLCMAVGFYFGGALADAAAKKLGDDWGRRLVPIAAMLVTGLSTIIATQMATPLGATLMLCFANVAISLGLPANYSTTFVFSQKRAGSLNGLMVTFASLGGVVAPIVTGYIVKGFGYDTALVVAGLTCLVGMLFIFFARIRPIIPKHKTA